MGMTGFDFARPELEVRFCFHAQEYMKRSGVLPFDIDLVWGVAKKSKPGSKQREQVLDVVADLELDLDSGRAGSYGAGDLDEALPRLLSGTSWNWISRVADRRAETAVVCPDCGAKVALIWSSGSAAPVVAIKHRDHRLSKHLGLRSRPGALQSRQTAMAELADLLDDPRFKQDVSPSIWESGGRMAGLSGTARRTVVIGGSAEEVREEYSFYLGHFWDRAKRADLIQVGDCRDGCGSREFSLDQLIASARNGIRRLKADKSSDLTKAEILQRAREEWARIDEENARDLEESGDEVP